MIEKATSILKNNEYVRFFQGKILKAEKTEKEQFVKFKELNTLNFINEKERPLQSLSKLVVSETPFITLL